MLKTIVAIERDGFNIRTLILTFNVLSKDFDLITAIKKAATDYCNTEDGRKIYEYNCGCFNYADFAMNVTNDFCKKYGFEMIDTLCENEEVDWDEQLVDNTKIVNEEEE